MWASPDYRLLFHRTVGEESSTGKTDRQVVRQTVRQTDRQTDRWSDRQSDRQMVR